MAILRLLKKLGSQPKNTSHFPDRIWSRHSALLIAAHNVSKQRGRV
jgi:hypothetical protein